MMNTLREIGSFVGIPQGSLQVARFHESRIITLSTVNLLVTKNDRRASMRALIQMLQNLTPITLEAQIVGSRSGEEPFSPAIRMNASGGITWFTTIEFGLLGGVGFSSSKDILSTFGGDFKPTQLGRGDWKFVVTRSGISNTGFVSLSKTLDNIRVSAPPEPTPTPTPTPPALAPHIEVSFSGSITAARFHVTGRGFLPNRPDNNQGVAIRVVDANILIETRREFTASSSGGAIDHEIVGDLTGLVLNAAGIATIAISATDGRPWSGPGPGDFLWSNTVRTDFS